jgi:16S rRNA (cytosine1402-N4)-methyltransferase
VPVLPAEVLFWLDPQPGQTIVDATLGGGGHARLVAERLGPNGRLIGLDQDPGMIEIARPQITGCQVTLVHSNFDQLRAVLNELGIDRVDGVLADLGFASDQMEDPARGLSFQQKGPLDMRFDPTSGEPAVAIIAEWSERDMADLFWKYGEERYSRRIARKIVEERKRSPITMTTQLAELIRRCVPRPKSGLDPATRVFQALRIAVNDELGSLERLLEQLPQCLRPGGRAVIISFQSLEDRRVKQTFKEKDTWEALTRKPVTASEEEVRNNPRARSAKLRTARLQGGRENERTQG